MALLRLSAVGIVSEQSVEMKTFFYVCGLLPLIPVSSSLANGGNEGLYHYISINSEIRHLIQSVSAFVFASDDHAHFLAEDLETNISALRAEYGHRTYEHFQNKYGAKAAEFAKNPKLSKDCTQYIDDLLKNNKKHQTELSQYIAEVVESWRIGFNNIYSKFTDTSAANAKVEKEAVDCGDLLGQDDPTLAYNCAVGVLAKVKKLEDEVFLGIFEESTNLEERKEEILMSLHNSVRDRFIPSFYNEAGIDGWLEKFCSGENREKDDEGEGKSKEEDDDRDAD